MRGRRPPTCPRTTAGCCAGSGTRRAGSRASPWRSPNASVAPSTRADFGSGGAWIDYRGPAGTVPTLSFADVLRGKFPAAAVRGKVVVIGATAPTLHDVHPTPASADGLMPGPEVQANAIWTAMNGIPLRNAPAPLGLIAIVALGLAVPLARVPRSPFASPRWAASRLGVAYAVAAKLLFDAGTVVLVAAPLASLALASVLDRRHLLRGGVPGAAAGSRW